MAIGAIMPLCISGSYGVDDLNRSEILFKSLSVFAEKGMFNPFLVVVPEHEVNIVKSFYGDKWAHLHVEVVSEEALVPELASHQSVRGWRKQQLIKLAAPRRLDNPFYITFDADVICLKPLTLDKLIINGRAVLQYEARAQHPKWWKSSARILQMDPLVGEPDVGMHITPAVLSRDLALSVTQEISKLEGQNWVHALCSLHYPKNPKNWTIGRYLKNKWTEYSLYYMNALKQGRFQDYHIIAGRDVTQLLIVHDSHPFEQWKPEKNFSQSCPGMFCVVGSKSFLSPETVWQTISPFIPFDESDVLRKS
ncbi:DUF6492 family protein [Aestuariibacter sp. AA17]|uniref:DUF6492 family protein n=1 Tax=Fluctibacter corallii TaxID=2984329 RepID=A0ABT3A654_9ALTE|nr:DUF6492 family protein [Aestuariibacter sp. AA17]MCV2884163.1 DUF6492 family protein [Aestuariibacter sp. AA17]